jgi:hypothetical protein
MSDHDELKMQLSTGVCFLFINFFFFNFPVCFVEVENSEIYRVIGTKSVVGDCFPFLFLYKSGNFM